MALWIEWIIKSYFSEKLHWYETDDEPKEYVMIEGTPQGSIPGALLWNIMYDGVLDIRVPKEETLIGFVDDLMVVVVAKYHPTVK